MHRGNRLADEGLGHADLFVCGYHGWKYGSDGTFVEIPDLETFPQGSLLVAAYQSCLAIRGHHLYGLVSMPRRAIGGIFRRAYRPL